MFIYTITNKLNNKIYIGQTIQKNPRSRWRNHVYEAKHNKETQCVVDKAIAKYGTENFEFLVIEAHSTSEELNQAEIYWIEHLRNALGKENVYNLLDGGQNGKHSEETRKKMSENSPKYWLGKNLPDDMKEKIAHGNKGKVISEEAKQKSSATQKGRPSPHKGKPKPIGFGDQMSQKKKTFTDEQEQIIAHKHFVEKITMENLAKEYRVGIGTIHRAIQRHKSATSDEQNH
jgi:group I intron endonuclease